MSKLTKLVRRLGELPPERRTIIETLQKEVAAHEAAAKANDPKVVGYGPGGPLNPGPGYDAYLKATNSAGRLRTVITHLLCVWLGVDV